MIIFKLAEKKRDFDLEKNLNTLIEIRKILLNDKVAREICDEFDFGHSALLGIPIAFTDEIDVAAKTKNGNMFLNISLIDEDFNIMMRYVIHELVHVFQHIQNKGKEDLYEGKEYLNRPDEIEAFQYQAEYDEKSRGMDDVVEYVEDLVDFHDVPEGIQDDKVDELMSNID